MKVSRATKERVSIIKEEANQASAQARPCCQQMRAGGWLAFHVSKLMILAGIVYPFAAVVGDFLDAFEEQGRQEAFAGIERDVFALDKIAVAQLEDDGEVREKSEVAFSDDEVVGCPTKAPGAQRVGQAVVHYSGQASVRVLTSAACPSAAAAMSR